MINNLETILRVLPRNISIVVNPDKIEEIRIRAQRPIILKNIDEEIIYRLYTKSKRGIRSIANILRKFHIYISKSNM